MTSAGIRPAARAGPRKRWRRAQGKLAAAAREEAAAEARRLAALLAAAEERAQRLREEAAAGRERGLRLEGEVAAGREGAAAEARLVEALAGQVRDPIRVTNWGRAGLWDRAGPVRVVGSGQAGFWDRQVVKKRDGPCAAGRDG